MWMIPKRKDGQPLQYLGFTPDHAQLILRDSDDGSIQVVDAAQGKLVRRFTPEAGDQSVHTILSPDATAVLMNVQTPEILAWDVKTGQKLPTLAGAKGRTNAFAFTPDGKTLVSGGQDSFVLVRDWPSTKVRRRLDLGRKYVQNLFVSADGRTLNVVFWWENTLHR
jgi:WD40 repeat protein